MGTNPTVLSSQELENRLINCASKTPSYPFLHSDSDSATCSEELGIWLSDIEARSTACDVSSSQWPDVATFFLPAEGDLKAVMSERNARYFEKTGRFWNWDEFKADLGLVVGEAAKISKAAKESGPKGQLTEFYKSHPYIAASASAGLIIGGSVVLLPALGAVALNAAGFTAGGIVSGSLAATIQSFGYGGLTTGLFSTFQSLGASMVLPGASAVWGGSAAVGAGASSLIKLQLERGAKDGGASDKDNVRGEDAGDEGCDCKDAGVGAPLSPPPSLQLETLD